MSEPDQTQPGAPDATPPVGAGVDPATGLAPAETSPSTVAAGDEHAAAPALDPGQLAEVPSPAAPTPAAAASPTTAAASEDDGYVSARPLLMIGAAGPEVAELGYLLAAHGFTNAISEGQAAAPPILDDALMRVVVDFQQQNGIDPWSVTSDHPNEAPIVRQGHLGVVDAATWEALLGYKPRYQAPGSEPAAQVNA